MDKYLIGKSVVPKSGSLTNTCRFLQVPLDMVNLIQDLLLKYKPDGIPVEELPGLYEMATNEKLETEKYGAKDIYNFLKLPCFKKVVEVRKRPKAGNYVKGCALGLTSITLLRVRRDGPQPTAVANRTEPETTAAKAEDKPDDTVKAIMPNPVSAGPKAVKAEKTESKFKPEPEPESVKKEEQESKPEIKQPFNPAAAETETGNGNAAASEPNVNTCRVVAVYGQTQTPSTSGSKPTQSEEVQTTPASASGKTGTGTQIKIATGTDAQAANGTTQPPAIAEAQIDQTAANESIMNINQSDTMTNCILSIFKEFQEGFKKQHEMMAVLTRRIEQLGAATESPQSRFLHDHGQKPPYKKMRLSHQSDEIPSPSSGSQATGLKAVTATPSASALTFADGQLFREKAKYYLKKYAKHDRVDDWDNNPYVLRLTYLSRGPRLTENEIPRLFPKAIFALGAPPSPSQHNSSRSVCRLELLFKRPKYTMSAYKTAKRVFGYAISVSYGEKD